MACKEQRMDGGLDIHDRTIIISGSAAAAAERYGDRRSWYLHQRTAAVLEERKQRFRSYNGHFGAMDLRCGVQHQDGS